jgi:hypothetical protein
MAILRQGLAAHGFCLSKGCFVVSGIPSPAQVFRNVRSRQSTSRGSAAVSMRMEPSIGQSRDVDCKIKMAVISYREVRLGLRSCVKLSRHA